MTLADTNIKRPFETDVITRLANLETHIINLIYPIQEATRIIRSPDLQKLMSDLHKAVEVFDKLCDRMMYNTKSHMEEMVKSFESIDIGQAFNEIKYIGNRLKEIECLLKEINEDGIKRVIRCKVEVEGFSEDIDIKKEKMNIK